jgi:hypothetical protein
MSGQEQVPNSEELFASLWEQKGAEQIQTSTEQSGMPEFESQEASSENQEAGLSPSDILDQLDQLDTNEDGIEEGTEEDSLAASEASETTETGMPSNSEAKMNDSSIQDIEEILVKGPEGRKQKLKVDYSDRKAIKQAFMKAAGMRKFQAERDAALKTHQELSKEHDGLKQDFGKIEKAFEEHGPKGIVELIGGEDAWQKAVDDELAHRDYVSNLSADEKYQLELKKRDEQYQKQLTVEKTKREEFQKQIEEREAQAELQKLESKLHPAFDRYRFAGKLGDTATENLYDEAIWSKVKERLAEYPDTLELNQAAIDKEFRTVASMFRKHIKTQTEKQVKKTVEKKKTETAQRAQVAAKKGLSGSTQQKRMLDSLRKGDLSSALGLWKSGN